MLGIYIFGSNEDGLKVYKFSTEKDVLWNRYIDHFDDIHDAITAFREEVNKLTFSNIWMIAALNGKKSSIKKGLSYSSEAKFIPAKKSDFIILAEYHYDKKTSSSNITDKNGGIDISMSFRNDTISLVRDGYRQIFNTNIGALQYIYDTIYKTGVNANLLINDKEFTDISKLQNGDIYPPVSFIIENPVIIEYIKHR